MKILVNDGISQAGVYKLESAGFDVIQKKVAQQQLANYLNENNISAILVRSATTVRKDLIDACPNLKLIGRGGVGLDNIDVDYAKSKGLRVINTPAASSRSVAELVFAHLLGSVRHLNKANREMPLEGETHFKKLKKSFKGRELKGKTLGVFGFGRIGYQVAKIGLAIGMKVLIYDNKHEDSEQKELPVDLEFANGQSITLQVKIASREQFLKEADFISLHVPAIGKYLIGKEEIEIMKDGAGIINASRGGVIDESAVDQALENNKLGFAALDVYENEPKPPVKLLMNSKMSLSPHIGGSTDEAQERIGIELADQIIAGLGTQK